MKALLHKSGSVAMALLLLFTTLSFRVDMHFCGDHLVDLSFTSGALGCGVASGDQERTDLCAMTGMDCCTQLQLVQQGREDLQQSFQQLVIDNPLQYVPATYPDYSQEVLQQLKEHEIPFKEYSPPLLVRDIPVLCERFLI